MAKASDTTHSRFATITVRDIRAMADNRTYTQARKLLREGGVLRTRLRDGTIEGTCGSPPFAQYQTTVTLPLREDPPDFPLYAACGCMLEQPCPHMLALLLAWINDPGRFEIVAPIAEQLAGRSVADLITIIVRMVERDPNLERIISLPVPPAVATGSPNTPSVSPDSIRLQVSNALEPLRRQRTAWDFGMVDSADIETLLLLSREYGHAGLWADVQVILAELATQAIDAIQTTDDFDESLFHVLVDCDAGLSTCLTTQVELPVADRLDREQRERLLRSIYTLWRFDTYELNGTGLSSLGPAAVAESVDTAERVMVEQWLASEKPDSEDAAGAAATFRMMLYEAADLTDEERLVAYREAARWEDVAGVLIRLGRIEEAIATAERHIDKPLSLMTIANTMIAADESHATRAIRLIEDHAWETEGKSSLTDHLLNHWLMTRYGEYGRPAEALKLADRRFAHTPDFESWQAVRDIALLPNQPPDAWTSRRPAMESVFRRNQDWAALLEAHLKEGEFEPAQAAMAELQRHMERYPFTIPEAHFMSLQRRLLEASEHIDPDRAIGIYRKQAEQLIAQRGRDKYQMAAQLLDRIRYVLEGADRLDEWPAIIDDVRSRYRNLPALSDELDARGV